MTFSGQAYFGASWSAKAPKERVDGTPDDAAYGTLQARDPLTGESEVACRVQVPSACISIVNRWRPCVRTWRRRNV